MAKNSGPVYLINPRQWRSSAWRACGPGTGCRGWCGGPCRRCSPPRPLVQLQDRHTPAVNTSVLASLKNFKHKFSTFFRIQGGTNFLKKPTNLKNLGKITRTKLKWVKKRMNLISPRSYGTVPAWFISNSKIAKYRNIRHHKTGVVHLDSCGRRWVAGSQVPNTADHCPGVVVA